MKLAGEGKSPKFFYGWWIVLVAATGLSVGYGPIIVYTFGVFFKPVSEEFNWSRAQMSLAFSLSLGVMVLAMPLIGRLVDRFGARKVILPSAIIFGATLLSLYFRSLGRWRFYIVYLVIGLVGAGTTPVPYNSVLSHWFDKKRGLALGLATIGIGLSTFIMPAVASALIGKLGWRTAYTMMGLLVIAVTVPVVGLFLKENPQMMGLTRDGEDVTVLATIERREALEGDSIRDAWHSRTFWLMCIAFFLISASVNGCLIHLVPMLRDRSISNQTAVLAASLLGGATLVGRAGTGYLLDRFFASHVAVCFFTGAGFGMLLLWGGAVGLLAVVAAILIGLGNGAEADIMAYQMSRYFGMRAFAEIYSYILAAYTLGGVVGPLVMGLSFDFTGSYRLMLMLFLMAVLVSVGLMMRLGPYRRWESAAVAV
ncbi:MAG: MFS transporter [Pyrinomonadaceae bacterium]